MKTWVLLIGVVVLVAVSVECRRRPRDSDDNDDDDVDGQRDYRRGRDGWHKGRTGVSVDGTADGVERGDSQRGGRWGNKNHHGGHRGHHSRGRYDKSWKSCTCRSQCEGNTGEKLLGCHTNRTAYLSCSDSACSVQLCADNQLFNHTSKACEACPAGFHVDANKRHCVCDEGTTFDFRTRTCTPCPTGAVVTADKCYCDNSVHDKKSNTCRDCPEGTIRGRHGCQCANRQEFWSWDSFSCVVCPGEWVSKEVSRQGRERRDWNRGRSSSPRTVQVCECQGEKEIFNQWSVTCMRCPDNSIVATSKWGRQFCDCQGIGTKYDWKTKSCVNRTEGDANDDDDDDNDAPQPE